MTAAGLLALFSLSRAWAGPLDYSSRDFPAELVEISRTARGVDYELRFPSPLKSPFKANDTVWGHLSLPRGPGPYRCILVLPIMAAPNIGIEMRFIDRFKRDGFAVLWLEMPYQFHRRPHPSVPSGQVFLARTARRLTYNFRQSVLDARRALDWLSSQPAIDPERIGLFGVSLGAMVGATVYSVDPTPKYAVFLLGGADFPSLMMGSSMTGSFIRKAGVRQGELRQAWKGIDPLDYKKKNRGKRALLVNVRSDTLVPRPNALRLKEAFPDSRQIWLPFGHYTSIVHLLWIPIYISRDFNYNL